MRVTHPTEEQILDAVLDGTSGRQVEAHAASCGECQARVSEVREGWTLAREADVPEPSPLYWEAMRRQVGRRIEGETTSLPPRWVWAFGALVLLLGVLSVFTSSPTTRIQTATLPAWSPLPPADDDPGLAVLEAVVPAADDMGECRLGECVADLSEDEGQAFADVLREEMEKNL